jgi:nucleoside-diphosphate-sugar epimerase
MRILVTGATGFIGRHLCEELSKRGHAVRASGRDHAVAQQRVGRYAEVVAIPDLGSLRSERDWREAVEEVDAVVHLAGLAHAMGGEYARMAGQYRQVNAQATRFLARACVQAGVGRLVLVSTSRVYGETSARGAFTEASPPDPVGEYAESKRAAEVALAAESKDTPLTTLCVRPPLVVGPQVRGNFPRLVRLIRSGWPLPLGGLSNRRSLISVWNLADFLCRALEKTVPAGSVLLPTDDTSPSTSELIGMIARADRRTARLLNVPASWLRAAGRLAGKRDEVSRLIDSFELDGRLSRRVLEWTPPLSLEEGLRRSVDTPASRARN